MMSSQKRKLFKPIHVGALGFCSILMGGLFLIQALNLDPDMIKLSEGGQTKSGVISAFRNDGIEFLDKATNVRAVYRPILLVHGGKNPALSFSLLADAQANGVPICFLTAIPENGGIPLAYDLHLCGDSRVDANEPVPGKHQYLTSLRGYGIATLLGYEDGTRAGDKGKSQLERNKYLLLSVGNATVRIQRGNTYGFPNGRLDLNDVGNRFCMTQHNLVDVKFSKDLKPVGLWESIEPETFLWTCQAVNDSGLKGYDSLFE
jgi:hypothetical protein